MKTAINLIIAIWQVISLIVIILLIPACTEVQTKYITVPLSRPERPLLPKIPSSELECVSVGTYQKLYDTKRLMRDYAVKLETIIDNTNKKVK